MNTSSRAAITAALVLLALPLVSALPASAQQEPAPTAVAENAGAEDAGAELARIRVTLERIADLLERQTEGQRVELAMRRLDVESQRALRLEREIATLQSNRESLEDERFRMQSTLLAMTREAERPGTGMTEEDLANVREQSELQIGMVNARIGELDRRLQELQNQLADRRETVRSWESFVDRRLEER